MENQDYNYVITTSIPAMEALDAISRVPEWWASDFEGNSQKLGDEFTVRFGEVSVNFRIVEFVPGKKAVWLVTDCNLGWLKDTREWKGTKIDWEVSRNNHSTQIRMTHVGLIPGLECYNDCKEGWNFHLGESLVRLITEGIGIPDVITRNG